MSLTGHPSTPQPRGPAPHGPYGGYLLPPEGQKVPLRRFIRHPLEILALAFAVLGSMLLLLVATIEVTQAINQQRVPDPYALILVLAPVVIYFARGQLYAQQRLRGVKLSPTQYPEAYQMVIEAAHRFGLSQLPDAYVVLGNGVINAAASGHGFRRYIFVYSDLFEVGGRARNPEALRFIIAHEVGHIAAGHASYWRLLGTLGSQWIPFLGSTLSRGQEYTADNYGYFDCPQGSSGAIATLAAGKYLNNTVDVNALADRAVSEKGFFVWLVNALASHPVLAWRAHALRDRSRAGHLLWRPRHQLWTPSGPGAPYLSPSGMPAEHLPAGRTDSSQGDSPAYPVPQEGRN
jgi:Zn-dependent protease with chaperone function